MARRFLTPIVLPRMESHPVVQENGAMYYNTVDNTIKIYANGAWSSLSIAGSSDIISAKDGILDHRHDYDGSVYSVSYQELVSSDKIFIDGGSASTATFTLTLNGGDASGD